MRDAVIHLAKTTAATYQASAIPAAVPVIGRIGDAAPMTPLPPPVMSRTGRVPKTESTDAEIVKLRLAGVMPTAIAAQLSLHPSTVFKVLADARKGGVPIPKAERGRPSNEEKAARTAKAAKASGAPKRWAVTMADLSAQGVAMVTKAANARGITPEAYLERRQLALRLAQEGQGWDVILRETKETQANIVSAWLSSARAAGHDIPYVAGPVGMVSASMVEAARAKAEPAPEPEPAPKRTSPIPKDSNVKATILEAGRHVFPRASELHPSAAVAIHKAAQRRAMSVAAYEEIRERIVRLRLGGLAPSQISAETGQGKQFVFDICNTASTKFNVVFPPISTESVEAMAAE
jgi:hypothetical protein